MTNLYIPSFTTSGVEGIKILYTYTYIKFLLKKAHNVTFKNSYLITVNPDNVYTIQLSNIVKTTKMH